MTQATDLIYQVRSALEDYGDTITDNQTGDGTTTLWKLSQVPILTNSELSGAPNYGALTVGGIQKTQVTDYVINYDNGELRFVTPPGDGVAIIATYRKVVWRDERILDGLNAGLRDMYSRGSYKIGECYILLQSLKYDYDLSSATDVPAASSFGDQTLPSQYNPGTARADLQKSQTRIHFAEYHPYGSNQYYTPFYNFGRTTPTGFHLDGDPTPNDTIRLVYSAPFTPLVNPTDVCAVPDEIINAPVWYALSVLMDKKEGRRARSDGYSVMQNSNANPPGTQAQTAEDYWQRYLAVMDDAMRPMRMTQRRRVRSFEYEEVIRGQ